MRTLLLIILSLSASLAMAAQTPAKPPVEVSPLGMQSLLETAGGLILILLLIFGMAWLFKRHGQLSLGGKGPVTLLGGISVGPRERVVVVSVEGTRLVLGVAPGQVRSLHVLGRDENSFEGHLAEARLEEQERSS
jgi:flagellar protein FliO/FliZ